MRKALILIFIISGALSAMADERGELRLERISRHYAALGNYSMSFVLRAGESIQEGELMVEGKNSYIKIAETELYVVDSLRYEVRGTSKEIIVDRADAYEKDLFNPLNGFSGCVRSTMLRSVRWMVAWRCALFLSVRARHSISLQVQMARV